MSHEAPINPVGMPETDPASIDPAVQAVIDAEHEQRLAEHEYDLAQIREDEGRKAIEDGLHNIAYTAEVHRLANDPSQLTGEHGLSGYDEMEHRARAAGQQAVENHRSRVAEIRAEADAEYERVRDFERAYEADKWEDVVIALDKMAAYAEKTDDWTEFDKHHDQLRGLERTAYMRHFDAQHPEEEPTPAPVTPEGGDGPEPAAPLAPAAAAAEAGADDEPEPTPAPATPADPGDDFMVMVDAAGVGGEPATRRVPEWSTAEHERVVPAPAAPDHRAVPSWRTAEDGGPDDGTVFPGSRTGAGEEGPAPARRRLPSFAEGGTDDEGGRPAFGERRLPSWDDIDPARAPRRREGALDEGEPLPLSPLEDTSGVGLPEQQPWSAPVVEERDPSFVDRWGGTTDAAGRVPGWTPKWFKRWRASVAEKKRREEREEEERLEGTSHVELMDALDREEAGYTERRRPEEVDERDIVVRGAGRRVDPRAHRDRGTLDEMLRDLDE